MGKINVEKLFLSALGSKKKLKWYLKKNVHLLEYIEIQWPKSLILVDVAIALIPKEKRKEMVGDIDAGRIINILEKDRPDLFEVLKKYPNGKDWIEKNIENFRGRFL